MLNEVRSTLFLARDVGHLLFLAGIKYEIMRAGLNNTQAARASGVQRTTFANYVAGRRKPGPPTITKIFTSLKHIKRQL